VRSGMGPASKGHLSPLRRGTYISRVNTNSAVEGPCSEATCVLVVDDDDDIRGLVEEVLADGGYATAGMPNGQVALDWLLTSPALPSLILLDLMMPEMDGWEFLARLEKEPRLRRIPVALMSAHPKVRRAFDGRASRLDRFFLLPKPIDWPRLLAIVAGAEPLSKARPVE
jgi:CheY-like chemotaxis protein